MPRVPQRDLDAVVTRINAQTGNGREYFIERGGAPPQPKLFAKVWGMDARGRVKDGVEEISPRLAPAAMLLWLKAFEAGIGAGYKNGYNAGLVAKAKKVRRGATA